MSTYRAIPAGQTETLELTIKIPERVETGEVTITAYYEGYEPLYTNFNSFTYVFKRKIRQLVVDMNPKVLNPKSQGNWISTIVETQEEMDIFDLDVSTLRISEIDGNQVDIPTETCDALVGDEDGDGIPDVVVKFDRAEVLANAYSSDIQVEVTGNLLDGTIVKGTESLHVLHKRR